MGTQDFAVTIILFIFADIIFYMVIMKGLLFTSIQGRSPAEEARAAKLKLPLFSAELQHAWVAPAPARQRLSSRAVGETLADAAVASQFVDFNSIVRQELQKLTLENVSFTPPYKLRVGEPRRVEMVITQNIVDSVTQAVNAATPAYITTLKASAHLSVMLQADDFAVTPLGPLQQRLGASGSLLWAWEITPLRSRIRTVGFDAVLQLKTASGDEKRNYQWRDAEIEVESNAHFLLQRFLARRWKLLLPLFLALLTGCGYAIWRVARSSL